MKKMNLKLYILWWMLAVCCIFPLEAQEQEEPAFQEVTDTADVYLPSDSLFARFLEKKHIPVTSCNRMTLLKSGRSKFEHLFEDIKKAEKYIHLEYFNFRSDSIAKELFTLLAEKAKEGVTIKALFDDFGNQPSAAERASEDAGRQRHRNGPFQSHPFPLYQSCILS